MGKECQIINLTLDHLEPISLQGFIWSFLKPYYKSHDVQHTRNTYFDKVKSMYSTAVLPCKK